MIYVIVCELSRTTYKHVPRIAKGAMKNGDRFIFDLFFVGDDKINLA